MHGGGKKKLPTTVVLLVDDHPAVLATWARHLESRGHSTLKATTHQTALELARARRPTIAIVDLVLRDRSGIDLVRSLKQLDSELFVVLVGGDMSVAHAMAAVRAGVDDVLVKPFNILELVDRIESGDPPDEPRSTTLTLEDVEWEHICRTLIETRSNISLAAQRLGIYRQTLQRKLKKRGRSGTDT